MKFYYLVGFGLEEFKFEELKFDEGKKKELSLEQKDKKEICDENLDLFISIQILDSVIIFVNSSFSYDFCVEEMEKLDLCVKK